MATSGGGGNDISQVLAEEFEKWLEESENESIYLLENERNNEGCVSLLMLLAGEYEFKLHCPAEYPSEDSTFHVETTEPVIKLWAIALNEYLIEASNKLLLGDVLNKAVALHKSDKSKKCKTESEDSEMDLEDMDEEAHLEPDDHTLGLSDDESVFTTEWELKVARKKKRWAQKEEEIRECMKKKKLVCTTPEKHGKTHGQPCMTGASNWPASYLWDASAAGEPTASKSTTFIDAEASKNIFTSHAASGVLTNDLVKIMQHEENVGFNAEPIHDNIYQWCVKFYNFDQNCDLASDLEVIYAKFGYKHIELQLDFTMDLYPFYPPIVKVMRPRLQGSMMQRVTNMEILKLSFWNPTKDMMNLLKDVKDFLQNWARLEVNSERNDRKKFPSGSYVEIEHHLLKLALVSEINPRANIKYHMEVEKPNFKLQSTSKHNGRKKEEFWAAGTGFGHNKRPEWDIKAYLAAQKEKDKQIESVLHSILHELKILYANHAPQLRPKQRSETTAHTTATNSNTINPISTKLFNFTSSSTTPSSTSSSSEAMDCDSVLSTHGRANVAGSTGLLSQHEESVDPVEDMYNILEGSAIIPFFEQYLKADSFLEICRHTVVYKAIVDIIREIALQNQLVPLLGLLSDQSTSVYQLLKVLEEKANTLLQHICKAGNGHVPKPSKSETHSSGSGKKGKNKHKSGGSHTAGEAASTAATVSSEEKLAREFQVLFRDVSEGFNRAGLDPNPPAHQQNGDHDDATEFLKTVDRDTVLEERYRKAIHDLQFDTSDIQLEGSHTHKYAKEYQKQTSLSQAQIFRIAQEVTSLATSLPLNLSSSIFVRTDDEKLTLMRALITGPEGTPYYGGCYLFDIFFPSTYPAIPPRFNLQTTGGGTVRFNPNLYNCGKVCLSLLGTWEGQQGEQWNETTSTILQVLVSIQSLILVPEPYFNEPGYEQEIGTDTGKRHSAEYNSDVRINSIKHAMIAQLQNPCPGLEDVIKTHFFVKRERILQEVEKWMRTDPSSKLERAYQNLKSELMRIELPPNVANILQDLKVQNITPVKSIRSETTNNKGVASSGSSSTTLKTESSHSSLGSSQLVTYGEASLPSENSATGIVGSTDSSNKIVSASIGSLSPQQQPLNPNVISTTGQIIVQEGPALSFHGPLVEDISSDESDNTDNDSNDGMCL